jgi:hypothetical protein
MRILAAALALLATPALAEGWQVQYLAGSGGSRPMVVDKSEAESAEAFVENERGERLILSCRGGSEGPGFFLSLYTPAPIPVPSDYADDGVELSASFGADPAQNDLGLFQAAQERYFAPLSIETFDRMMAAPTIRLYATVADYAAEFPLQGFTAAAAEVTCGG